MTFDLDGCNNRHVYNNLLFYLYFQAEGENEVNNELANRISLFYADATPMLKTLSDGTTKFVSEVRPPGDSGGHSEQMLMLPATSVSASLFRTRTCRSRTRQSAWARWRASVKSCWKHREWPPWLVTVYFTFSTRTWTEGGKHKANKEKNNIYIIRWRQRDGVTRRRETTVLYTERIRASLWYTLINNRQMFQSELLYFFQNSKSEIPSN